VSKKKKKRKRRLREKVGAKLSEGEQALVVCVGDKCCSRKVARALADDARTYAAGRVRIELVGCFKICKKGPLVATLPKIKFYRRVDTEEAHALVDKLVARAGTVDGR
jgi:(2Fe-2S) ferredoxin